MRRQVQDVDCRLCNGAGQAGLYVKPSGAAAKTSEKAATKELLGMPQQDEALESRPAMNDTTGFVVPLCLMKSAASSSAVPPISPIMMMPSVCTQRY